MKIIATKLGKNDKYDQLRCIRLDGSETSTMMPRQGGLPHDLIHYVVESALRYDHGFLGLVAKGADISFAMEQTHDLGNQALADQATHAEAIVESLQAQLWSGAFDVDMFQAGLEGACEMRERRAPDLNQVDVEDVLYGGVIALSQRWQSVPFHAALELDMPGL
jgi:hypothetical protein